MDLLRWVSGSEIGVVLGHELDIECGLQLLKDFILLLVQLGSQLSLPRTVLSLHSWSTLWRTLLIDRRRSVLYVFRKRIRLDRCSEWEHLSCWRCFCSRWSWPWRRKIIFCVELSTLICCTEIILAEECNLISFVSFRRLIWRLIIARSRRRIFFFIWFLAVYQSLHDFFESFFLFDHHDDKLTLIKSMIAWNMLIKSFVPSSCPYHHMVSLQIAICSCWSYQVKLSLNVLDRNRNI